MKRIRARETARLLGSPVVPEKYAREVTQRARVVTKLQLKRVRLRRELAKLDRELREAQRMLRLAAQSLEPLDTEGDLS